MKKLLAILSFALFTSSAMAGTMARVQNFGANPGSLVMYKYVPENLKRNQPMVVLMHGCQQNARTFANETGWTKLADEYGITLLLPEQTTANNGMMCFTWFEKGDVTRGNGEIASIANMMDHMENNHNIDKDRVFVAGLSAGGTMASALMASYPDLINAGAIVSGVSYGCAFQLFQSFTCMFAPSNLPAETRGDYVREASGDYTGKFPKVTVMHGSNDPFVRPANGDHSVAQWTNVHGLDDVADNTAPMTDRQGMDQHISDDGEVLVNQITVQGAGHGWPVNTASGCGSTSQFVINTSICAAKVLAETWAIAK